MPVLQVLLDANGSVIGTALTGGAGAGTNPPVSATLVAGPGQRVTQLTVDDKTFNLDATALHLALKTTVKPG